MKGYELVFITNPDLNEEDLAAILNKAKETLSQAGGTLFKEYLWGRRRLAYEIAGKSFGVYHAWYFTGTGETVSELQRQFGYSDDIIRNQTVSTEDLEGDAAYFCGLMQSKDDSNRTDDEVDLVVEEKATAETAETEEKATEETEEAVEA